MDIVGIVTKATKVFLDVNTISVDNWTFKMYYKVTVMLTVFCSLIVTSRQFFGSPINCDAGIVSVLQLFLYMLFFAKASCWNPFEHSGLINLAVIGWVILLAIVQSWRNFLTFSWTLEEIAP